MKFVKKYDDAGKALVVIDTEGLEIPEDLKSLLVFSISTYKALGANQSQEEWDKVFSIPEAFVNTLSGEEQIYLAGCYCACHQDIQLTASHQKHISLGMNDAEINHIKNHNANLVHELETKLSDTVASLDLKIDLYHKIHEYVEKNIPIKVADNIGSRAQDSDEMTFKTPDLVDLTAVAVLCKLMTPIVGVFIRECSNMDISQNFKEIHAANIFRDIIANECQAIADKLENYLANTIDSNEKAMSKNKLTNLYNGFSTDMSKMAVTASMYTRKFITVDLSNTESNLMTYVNTCAKGIVSTKSSGSKKDGGKITVAERKLPDEFEESYDDGNSSVLEAESSASKETADFNLIISFAVQETIKHYLNEFSIDREVYDAAYVYYSEMSHPTLGNNNEFILSTLFGRDLCGAKSIESLTLNDLAALLPLAQIYCYRKNFRDMVHLLSLLPTNNLKLMQNSNEMRLRESWKSSNSYRNCDERFNFETARALRWDTALEKLINDVTSRTYLYNTAPAICEMMGEEVTQTNKIYTPPITLATTICDFINDLFSRQDEC